MLGLALSSIQEACRLQDDTEARQTATSTLADFQDLAELQLLSFTERVKINRSPHPLPAQQILSKSSLTRYNASPSASDIAAEISAAYASYADADAAQAIAAVLAKALSALLTSTPASPNKEVSRAFLSVGAAGRVVRVDVQLYARVFASAQMLEVARNVVIMSVVVSEVDVAAVEEGRVLDAVRSGFVGVERDVVERCVERVRRARS